MLSIGDNLVLNLNFLNTHFVYPVDQFYINRSTNPIPKYFYDKNKTDLCYGYVLGQDKRGIVNVKLYFPNRNKKLKLSLLQIVILLRELLILN